MSLVALKPMASESSRNSTTSTRRRPLSIRTTNVCDRLSFLARSGRLSHDVLGERGMRCGSGLPGPYPTAGR